MINFHHKKISGTKTLGEKLAEQRKEQGLSIDKAGKILQINCRYLKMLENDDYQHLPPETYTKNFIKKYCKLLNLNDQTAIILFNKEKNIFLKTHKTVENKNKTQKKPTNKFFEFFIKPQTIKYSIILIVFFIILFYIFTSVNKIFLPPELLIKYPSEDNIVINNPSINIEGVTEKEVELFVNAKQVIYDDNGRFNITLNLQKGLNIIKITAKKKHSETTTIYKQIIFEPQIIENNP